jgi:hypothetical protein
MKIIAMEQEKPGLHPDQFAPHLRAEAARLWDLYESGPVREFYFRQDRSEAVLVLECTNTVEARQVLDSLPLVQAGLITFELIPLTPYTGFARLFDEQAG